MKTFKTYICIIQGMVFLFLSSAHVFAVTPEVEKAGNSTMSIEFFDKEDGKLIRKGCGVVIDQKGSILVYNMLFRKALWATARTDSGGPYPVEGICGENRDIKLWEAVLKTEGTAIAPASLAALPPAVGDRVFMKNPWKKGDGFLEGKVLKKNGAKVKLLFSSNVPANLKGAPIFDCSGKIAGILTDVSMKKESPYALAVTVTSDIRFNEFNPLGILDWKLKLEKEWKESPKGIRHAANYHIMSKDYKSAIPLLKKLVKKVPAQADAWSRLGYAYGKSDEFGKSIEAYQKVIELAPDNPRNHFNLGQAFAGAGQYKEAVEATQKAISMDPDNHWAHYNLGVVYLAMGNVESAMKEKEILEKLRPNLAQRLVSMKEKGVSR